MPTAAAECRVALPDSPLANQPEAHIVTLGDSLTPAHACRGTRPESGPRRSVPGEDSGKHDRVSALRRRNLLCPRGCPSDNRKHPAPAPAGDEATGEHVPEETNHPLLGRSTAPASLRDRGDDPGPADSRRPALRSSPGFFRLLASLPSSCYLVFRRLRAGRRGVILVGSDRRDPRSSCRVASFSSPASLGRSMRVPCGRVARDDRCSWSFASPGPDSSGPIGIVKPRARLAS